MTNKNQYILTHNLQMALLTKHTDYDIFKMRSKQIEEVAKRNSPFSVAPPQPKRELQQKYSITFCVTCVFCVKLY